MSIVVRDYLKTDLDDVNYILDEVFSVQKNNFNSEDFHEIVATIDNKVIGYLLMSKVFNPILSKYYYWLDYVSVLESYRGMGVGDKLLEYAEVIARKENADYLQLSCGYQRKAAHVLYEKNGFVRRESDLFRKELV